MTNDDVKMALSSAGIPALYRSQSATLPEGEARAWLLDGAAAELSLTALTVYISNPDLFNRFMRGLVLRGAAAKIVKLSECDPNELELEGVQIIGGLVADDSDMWAGINWVAHGHSLICHGREWKNADRVLLD